MRIACVNQDPGISPDRHKGAAVHLTAMRRALAASGAEVLAIDASSGADVRAALTQANAEAPIDIIYERFALGATEAASFAVEHAVFFVLEMNAPLSVESARWRGTRVEDMRTDESFVVRQADYIVAVSSAVARYAVALGAEPGVVEVMPNGVDTERFRPRPVDDSLRDTLVPVGRLALGFHGRLRPWHGFGRLVEVFRALVDLSVPVHLVVIGEGSFDAELTGRIAPDRITRIPWVDHDRVGEYVATFDLQPLTYSPDTPCYFSPLKLAEAMACGVVPIVPDLGDLTTIVDHEADGLVYSATRLDQLVELIRGLASNPSERARLGRAAREKAIGLSWNRIAATVLDVAREGVTRISR